MMDVVFNEDDSNIFMGHAAMNFAILKRVTLNVLRLDEDKKTSLRGKRKKAGWSNEYMAGLLKQAAIKKL
jgi:hypothetical protein